MRVISRRTLREFWENHSTARNVYAEFPSAIANIFEYVKALIFST
ncbi:MAG: hypothetical protein ACYT04_41310 [Nostoc sp.]